MPNGHSYSLEEVERALHYLARESGNTRKAARELEAAGHLISRDTLKSWRTYTHKDRYEEIRENLAEKLDRDLAEEMAAITRDRLELMQTTAEQLRIHLQKGNHNAVKDLAAADRNLGTVAGITNQNNRLIREKPTAYTRSDITQDQLLERLRAIPGLLTEVVDADVVEDPQLPPALPATDPH